MKENTITLMVALAAIIGIGVLVTNPNLIALQVDGIYQQDPIGEPLANTCIDSDGGNNPEVAGSVSFYKAGEGSLIYEDLCLDERTLKEYYCVQIASYNRVFSNFVSCSCVDGKCVG